MEVARLDRLTANRAHIAASTRITHDVTAPTLSRGVNLGSAETRSEGCPPQHDLIIEHIPMVRYLAKRLHWRLPEHVDTDDLVSAGMLGLMDAAAKFRSDKTVNFRTYATFRVRGAMLDSLRAMDWASRNLRTKERAAKEAIRLLTARLNRSPLDAEVAGEMGLSLGEYQRLGSECAPLELRAHEAENGLQSDQELIDNLPDVRGENPLACCIRSELRDRMASALDGLHDRERLVMALHYYEQLSMTEIAKTLGLSISRISQIHTSALANLRIALSDCDDRSRLFGSTAA